MFRMTEACLTYRRFCRDRRVLLFRHHAVACLPFPQTVESFSNPVLGDPIAFAQCAPVPGSDTPMTLPVYTLPSGLALMPGQSVLAVMASAVSSRPEGWSSGMPQTFDVSREGPFDAYASPMDTEDSPYRGARVCSAVVSFPGVVGTTVRRGGCSGSCGQSTAGRWYHVVKLSDSFAVCDVAASNVFRDDSGDGTCGVPFRGGCGFVYNTEGAPGSKVHGCGGSMAPTDWSGRSRAGAGFILQRLHELSVLLPGRSASDS